MSISVSIIRIPRSRKKVVSSSETVLPERFFFGYCFRGILDSSIKWMEPSTRFHKSWIEPSARRARNKCSVSTNLHATAWSKKKQMKRVYIHLGNTSIKDRISRKVFLVGTQQFRPVTLEERWELVATAIQYLIGLGQLVAHQSKLGSELRRTSKFRHTLLHEI